MCDKHKVIILDKPMEESQLNELAVAWDLFDIIKEEYEWYKQSNWMQMPIKIYYRYNYHYYFTRKSS